MPGLFAPLFALAGLVATSIPILVHLLNRRRFRVVEWAAMPFLREALRRRRRFLRLRDLLLLAARAAALLLLGLALARPYLGGAVDLTGGPVHVILVVDNSASMGWARGGRSTLDEARDRCREIVRGLPGGSRVSVLPVASGAGAYPIEPYASMDDVEEALAALETVDRDAPISRALELAAESARRVPELATKRVVLVTDLQRSEWPTRANATALESLGSIDVARVGPEARSNSWVASVHPRDVIVAPGVPVAIGVRVRHEGPESRAGVMVRLEVDGAVVATRPIDLVGGQDREVIFEHVFDAPVAEGRPTFVAVSAALDPDDLPADDRRHVVVPVLYGVPVLFVDELGSEEDANRGRLGESAHLRRLLGVAGDVQGGQGLVDARHLRVDELTDESLAEARVVFVCGVESPAGATPTLRAFVEAGGQLVITAGARFDPAAWTQSAWSGGMGVLPMPLSPSALGEIPDRTQGELSPVFLDAASLRHEWFRVSDAAEMGTLWGEPLIFRCVEPVLGDAERERLVGAETRAFELLGASEAPVDVAVRIAWESPPRAPVSSLEQHLEQVMPRVLGRYTNGVPFLVERRIGQGSVVLVTTGVRSSWSDITRTHAVLLFDRMFRDLVRRTIPATEHLAGRDIAVPIAPRERTAEFEVELPDGSVGALVPEARGARAWGLTIRDASERGFYTITARQRGADGRGAGVLWRLPLALDGPEPESDLRCLPDDEVGERVAGVSARVSAPGEVVPIEGAEFGTVSLWKAALLACLAMLLLEMGVLVVSSRVTGAGRGAAPALSGASEEGVA